MATFLAAGVSGCGSSKGSTDSDGKTVIRVDGSDTMSDLAQAWSEEYNKMHPNVIVQVASGGSGVGISNLINGDTDLANSSREMKPKEWKLAQSKTGKEAKEFIVGRDALAVYVHKENPIGSISIDELAEIYGDDGETTSWSQLDVENTICKSGEIKRISRQNSSGTYHYFQQAVLGDNRDYKLASIALSGSKEVVELVAQTPCAIGYSGMGYRTDDVKWLKIAKKKGDPGVEPSVESVQNESYLIARPLYIYMAGEPTGAVKEYLDWIMSEPGQKIVLKLGYVPLKKKSAE
jgi:phosphate transport system substrate-binding protein